MGGPGHVPTALPPVNKSVTYFTGGLCGSRNRSGRVRKISPSPRFDPRTVQPVTSRYTEYAIAASGMLELRAE